MNCLLKSVFIFMMISSQVNAQQAIRISGFVRDKTSGESLIGATIVDKGTRNGTMTDYNGYFSVDVNSPYILQFSFLGYVSEIIKFKIKSDTLVNILLVPGTEQLSEVVVTAQRKTDFNIANINYLQMTQIPSLGGKPDVIKSLQLMPGISSQNEGSSLMLVRGGDPGQNLYLFDNVPLIYVNHLGGFLSVFNPEIINNIDVYKGGFPSRYGGKLSSVVDITQKEGNNSGLKGSLGIGITDASFSVEGPLKIKNTNFIITGRKTLIDPLMALVSGLSEGSAYIISYGFHDLNGKFTWKPDLKRSISLNVYQGDDYLNYWSTAGKNSTEKNRMGNIWGNWLVSVRLNSIISSRLYASNSISFTRYRLKEFMRYSLTGGVDTVKFNSRYRSVVQDMSYKSGLKYNASENWVIDFGLQTSLLRLIPNDTYMSNRDIQQSVSITNSLETAVYADNKITFSGNNSIIPGIRIINFSTRNYSGFSFEPRFNLNIAVTKNHTLNASYMRVTQYSHLIFTAGSIMNNEVWIPSGKSIPPAKSEQYTLGWKADIKDNSYSSELNVYYKKMHNLSTFREGYTSLMGDENWFSKVETGGIGESTGIECFIRKNTGSWTGFISYILSRTTRQFPGINKGEKYIFDYNRPHSLSVNISHKLNEKISFNMVWIFQSGLPYTAAIGKQYLPSLQSDEQYYYEALIYGERNGSRLKDYHRLDLGMSYSTLTKKGNNKAVWKFSVYNVYNRHNPVYYYYNTNNSGEIYMPEKGGDIKPVSLYQLSLFPIIPTLSYQVFFDGNNSRAQKDGNKQKVKWNQKFRNWLYQKN